MSKVAAVTEKCGLGKTTVALNLAIAAIIEADQQVTASKSTDRRSEEKPSVVPMLTASLPAAIKKAEAQGLDFLVIRAPPSSGTEAAEAARPDDAVLIPVKPHLFARETLPKPADLLKLAGNAPER